LEGERVGGGGVASLLKISVWKEPEPEDPEKDIEVSFPLKSTKGA